VTATASLPDADVDRVVRGPRGDNAADEQGTAKNDQGGWQQVRGIDPDEGEDAQYNPSQAGQAIDHDVAAELWRVYTRRAVGGHHLRMFCGAVECLNHQADADDDRRNRRQRRGRYAGKGDNRQHDHRDPRGTFGQQTDRLRLVGEPSPFDICSHL
jgi:hypothetical protein